MFILLLVCKLISRFSLFYKNLFAVDLCGGGCLIQIQYNSPLIIKFNKIFNLSLFIEILVRPDRQTRHQRGTKVFLSGFLVMKSAIIRFKKSEVLCRLYTYEIIMKLSVTMA